MQVGPDQVADRADVTGQPGMPDRGVDLAALREPPVGPVVQHRDHRRLAVLQLREQCLPQQRVVPVLLVLTVHRDDRQGTVAQVPQHHPGSGGVADRVAQRAGQFGEDRGAGEESQGGLVDPGQHLGPQVVRHQAIAAGRGQPGAIGKSPGGDAGERQHRRPPFADLDQRLGGFRRRQVPPRGGQRSQRLIGIESHFRGGDLENAVSGTQPAQPDRDGAPRGDHQLRSRGHTGAQGVDHPTRSGVGDQLGIVQDQHERRRRGGQRIVRRSRRSGGRGRQGCPVRRPPAQRGDRLVQVAAQLLSVVVGVVDGQPGERALVGGGPLGEHRRLAVPGRRVEHDDREHRRTHQLIDQGGPPHHAVHGGRGGEPGRRRPGVERCDPAHHRVRIAPGQDGGCRRGGGRDTPGGCRHRGSRCRRRYCSGCSSDRC